MAGDFQIISYYCNYRLGQCLSFSFISTREYCMVPSPRELNPRSPTPRANALLTELSLACVAWRFRLGALSNKGGRGQRNREEIGVEASYAAPAPGSTKPPCYAG